MMADLLVFAFPILVLSVPRGAGVFLAGTIILAIMARKHLSSAWRENAAVLTPLALSVMAFMVVCVGSKLFHDTPWNVLDNPSRAVLAVVCCWVIVSTSPNAERLWRSITIALIVALAVVIFQKVIQHSSRPSAWTQAIAFANMVAALALVGFARPGEGRAVQREAWLNIACAAGILMLNGTRGAAVAMLVTAVPMLLIRYRRFTIRKFLTAVATVVVLGTGAYFVPGSPVSQRLDQAVLQVREFQKGNIETDVGVRLKVWEIGGEYFLDHPWSGAGVGQFAKILHTSSFCQQTNSLACELEHAHNDVVEAAATMGLMGLLTTLALFLVPAGLFARALRISVRHRSDCGVGLSGAGLGVVMASLISGLTQVTTAHQANIVFYAGIIGLLLGLAQIEVRALTGKHVPPRDDAAPKSNLVRAGIDTA